MVLEERCKIAILHMFLLKVMHTCGSILKDRLHNLIVLVFDHWLILLDIDGHFLSQ